MQTLKFVLAAVIAAASLAGTAAYAADDNALKARCENEAKAEGITEADEVKAYVYTCLALAEADAAAAVKPAGEKKADQ